MAEPPASGCAMRAVLLELGCCLTGVSLLLELEPCLGVWAGTRTARAKVSGARRVATTRSRRAFRGMLDGPLGLDTMILPPPPCFAQNLRTKDFRSGPPVKKMPG